MEGLLGGGEEKSLLWLTGADSSCVADSASGADVSLITSSTKNKPPLASHDLHRSIPRTYSKLKLEMAAVASSGQIFAARAVARVIGS